MKSLPPYAVWRMTCLCHEARLRFGNVYWAWPDDDRIPLRSGLPPRLRYCSVRQHAIENHSHPGGIDGRSRQNDLSRDTHPFPPP
jgi:hypothetical protein